VTPRSSLFAPAHIERRFESAASAGADAVVLDLEDSVPVSHKPAARAGLAKGAQVIANRCELLVRVNSEAALLADDLEACAAANIGIVLFPKVSHPRDVERLFDALARLQYAPRVGILIESYSGVARLTDILDRAGPLYSVALGPEDLRAEIELSAPTSGLDSEALKWAHCALVVAAAAAGVPPLGALGSITNLDDLARWEQDARAAWQLGYRGAYCVHPRQVPALNVAYSPSEHDRAWARAVLEAYAHNERDGLGAFRLDGAMVDAPHVQRARRILAIAHSPSGDAASETTPSGTG
jgi:citrate lyase subunit beta/citryl-CoA lyase